MSNYKADDLLIGVLGPNYKGSAVASKKKTKENYDSKNLIGVMGAPYIKEGYRSLALDDTYNPHSYNLQYHHK